MPAGADAETASFAVPRPPAGAVTPHPRWRRLAAAAVVLATPVDLLVALLASVHALYYVALLLFVPLALLRAVLAIGAAVRVVRPDGPARWIWAGTLLHAATVAAVLHRPALRLLRGEAPGIGLDPWPAVTLFVAWPYVVTLLCAAALVREMRGGAAAEGGGRTPNRDRDEEGRE